MGFTSPWAPTITTAERRQRLRGSFGRCHKSLLRTSASHLSSRRRKVQADHVPLGCTTQIPTTSTGQASAQTTPRPRALSANFTTHKEDQVCTLKIRNSRTHLQKILISLECGPGICILTDFQGDYFAVVHVQYFKHWLTRSSVSFLK